MLQQLEKQRALRKATGQKGFTIIEVMIVLAIAGLIMVIVFLAVPNLQRSQRNQARRSDAGNVAAAASNFVTNNNGVLPGGSTYLAATAVTDGTTIANDASKSNDGHLGQLDLSGGGASAVGSDTKLAVIGNTAGTVPTAVPVPTSAKPNQVVLELNASCSGASLAAGTSRQMALLYPIEKGSSNYAWGCLDV